MPDQIYGFIERITFQNPENGYTIAKLKMAKHQELICIVGNMPDILPGETIRCFGEWSNHLIHGRQFLVTNYKIEAPSDVLGISKYLGSGLIKGIGPVYAKRIVEKFGANSLNVIDHTPNDLLSVEGLGKKRLESIKSCWDDQKIIRELIIFLQSNGISPGYAQKIFKSYGQSSIQKIKENPFHLARDIFGIGFKSADSIATKMGILKDAPQRIDSGIEYTLSQLSSNGHVCYPAADFFEEAEKVLEVKKELIEERSHFLKDEGRIEFFDLIYENEKKSFLWLKKLFLAEIGIAKEIKRLKRVSSHLRKIDLEKAIAFSEKKLKIKLAANQKKAVCSGLKEKLLIITGGPGTGKSTITKAILTITSYLAPNIILTAPTGRAAKRMSEITGRKASTIHSLLEFDFKTGGFKKGHNSSLDCSLIIIDESSMIDTFLMYSLLRAIPESSRVIFIGDINQLPSVGPGNVLKDMIDSKSVPVVMLEEIFRQAAGSKIVTNAHKINRGDFPDLGNFKESDFFFLEAKEAEDALKNIIQLVSIRLPRKYGFHPLRDIQVLTPMRKGIIGAENLNFQLQQVLNGKNEPLFGAGKRFAVGDKVMQIRNDYKREVFNGDIGEIKNVDEKKQQMVVTIDERDVVYEFSDLDELVLAYAVSIHKSQGSEYPCVVIPVHTSHFMLLCKNLLYTAVTRGKKLVVLVGSKKAIAITVKNDDVKKRFTGLRQALIEIAP
ncbi:MAG TPA: ATP-dependent RecD-like DNA helicase [Parachlamydiaceae bacterium]|nr:ATP-dependent RecD-like DNA helicase [Parachlamydiaceae bacterium]